jgi:hypothetical protein
MVDFRISNVGASVVLVEPVTEEAKAFVSENVEVEGWAWMGRSFAVDPRYLDGLVALAEDAGLTVGG